MQISWLLDGRESAVCGLWIGLRFVRKSLRLGLGSLLLALWLGGAAMAQADSLVLERDGRVISLVPYAPNILRVTMSTDKAAATGAPGYGFVASRRRRDGRTSATQKATMSSDRPGWWSAWRRENLAELISCRSRCRSMR